MPSVLAAFRSLFILLQLPGSVGGALAATPPPPTPPDVDVFSPIAKPASTDCRSDVNPADMPLICRCLFSKAAATLLLQKKILVY